MAMTDLGPSIQTINAEETGDEVRRLVGRVTRAGKRLVVEEGGAAVAAIVPAADLWRLHQWERERAELFAGLSEISAAFADVPVEELEREVAKAIAEGREAARRERLAGAAAR